MAWTRLESRARGAASRSVAKVSRTAAIVPKWHDIPNNSTGAAALHALEFFGQKIRAHTASRMEFFALARLVVWLVLVNGESRAQRDSTRGANKASGVIIAAQSHQTWLVNFHGRRASDANNSRPLALGVIPAAVIQRDKRALHGRLAPGAYKAARVVCRALSGKTRLADQNGRPAPAACPNSARALTLAVIHAAVVERHK